MDRLACIRVPQLPLQLALRVHSEWTGFPVVVVHEDKPASPILFLNRKARNDGLKPGLRYSEALSIVPEIRATVISKEMLEEARRSILEVLKTWSPEIEPCSFDQEVFWVNADGLSLLYGTLMQWGVALRSQLSASGYRSRIVIGFTRNGTYILARHRSTVVQSRVSEQRALQRCPINSLPLSFRAKATLEKLKIRTIADLVSIPRNELARRLGVDFLNDLRLLEELATIPIQPAVFEEIRERRTRFDFPIVDLPLLIFPVEELLFEVLQRIRQQGRLVAELELRLRLETGDEQIELLRPAEPTSHERTLRRLLRFRLSRCRLQAPVVSIGLVWQDVPTPPGSDELFPLATRDEQAGAQAIALIRAKFGNKSVVQASLCNSHVPELSFQWLPLEKLASFSTTRKESSSQAVRRIFLHPRELSRRPAGTRIGGPFFLSLSFLSSESNELIDREYEFLKNFRSEVFWVRKDCLSGRFRIDGVVD